MYSHYYDQFRYGNLNENLRRRKVVTIISSNSRHPHVYEGKYLVKIKHFKGNVSDMDKLLNQIGKDEFECIIHNNFKHQQNQKLNDHADSSFIRVKSKQERKENNASIYQIKMSPFHGIDVEIYEEKGRISLIGHLWETHGTYLKKLQNSGYHNEDVEEKTIRRLEQLTHAIQRKMLFNTRKPYLVLLEGCNNNAIVDCNYFHYLLNDLICREISSFIV